MLRRNFNNQPSWQVVGDRRYYFRSILEHRWAKYCQWRKEQKVIKDWWYEQTTFRFPKEKAGAVKYLVDFDIRNNDNTFHYEECKGYLCSKDTAKFRKVVKYYPDARVVLVMQQNSKRAATSLRIAAKYCYRLIFIPEINKQLRGVFKI